MSASTSDFDRLLSKRMEDHAFRESFENAITTERLIRTLVGQRQAKGLTQTEVARRMGVKQPMVSGFENEGSDPRLSTILRYARAVCANVRPVVIPSPASAWEVRADAYARVDGPRSTTTKAQAQKTREWVEAMGEAGVA